MVEEHRNCLSFEDLDKYVNRTDEMTEEEIYAVDNHLGYCETCAKRAMEMRKLKGFWEEWTAGRHGDYYKKMQNTRLMSCSLKTGSLQEWFKDQKKRIGAAVRVLIDMHGEASRIILEKLEQPAGTKLPWRFAYAGTRGGKGSPARPRRENKVIAVADSGETIVVSARGNKVNVRLEGFKSIDAPMRVLLVSETDGVQTTVSEFKRDESREGCWVGEFSDVLPGNYYLVFEPEGDMNGN
ncbi:MAG: hypothetical protein QHH75_03760 [Bacillota bacterium]|nr:hypothetical protein [Bacillota bacterium]